jgi:site-specific recombinase XerD
MIYADPLISDFVADLLRKNRSPRSQEAYARDLSMFTRFLGAPIKDATRQDINRYTLYLLTERKYKVVTARRNLSTLRTFFKYLRREGLRDGNPAEDVELPKPEQRKPKVLRVNEVVSMLGADRGGYHAVRDRAILELLYGSGIRRAEVANLTLDSLDFLQRTAIVNGKGNKRRMVPLTEASISAMQLYLHVRPAAEDDAFFLSNRNTKLGLRQVWKIVKDYAVAGGVPRASTHAMRHSFATHFIEGGGDLSSLQRLLGHASIATTQIYIDQSVEHLRKQFTIGSLRDKPEFAEALRGAK